MVVLKDEADGVQTEISQLVIAQSPDIGPFDCHLAGVGTQDAGNHAEQRGLAAAGGADDEQHLAKVSDKPDTIHGSHLGLAFAKPFCQIGCDDRLIFYWFYAVDADRFICWTLHQKIDPLVSDRTSLCQKAGGAKESRQG